MTKEEYIVEINKTSDAEATLELWRQAAHADALTVEEIVLVHKACGKKLVEALDSLGYRRGGENEEKEKAYL